MEDFHILAEYYVGSKLYGTQTPDSDTDISGFFVAPQEYYIGLKNIEELNRSEVIKDAAGKNTSAASDVKYYDIKKFIRLLLDNNPNILEHLFVPDQFKIRDSDWMQELQQVPHRFVHVGLIPRFVGYASAQKHKMILKKDNYEAIEMVLENLRGKDPSLLLAEIWTEYTNYIMTHPAVVIDVPNGLLRVGDLNIEKNITVKRAIRILEDRLAKATNRSELLKKYGYDCKFASHLIRLLLEAEELLTTGVLVFPLTYADTLVQIKSGQMEMEAVLEYAGRLEDRLRALEKEGTRVAKKPDFEFASRFTQDVIRTISILC